VGTAKLNRNKPATAMSTATKTSMKIGSPVAASGGSELVDDPEPELLPPVPAPAEEDPAPPVPLLPLPPVPVPALPVPLPLPPPGVVVVVAPDGVVVVVVPLAGVVVVDDPAEMVYGRGGDVDAAYTSTPCSCRLSYTWGTYLAVKESVPFGRLPVTKVAVLALALTTIGTVPKGFDPL
jgi:hypothetical protein